MGDRLFWSGSKTKSTPRERLLQKQRYGVRHRQTRQMLAPFVASGSARCVRCQGVIEPGQAWDLGHDDRHSWAHSGPEHAVCNRGAPNRNSTSRVW